jgi:hypothetical protein
MASGHFDRACRVAVRLNPQGFLDAVFPEVRGTLRFEQWLDPRAVPLPGIADRTGDTIAQVKSALQPDWHGALPIEYQARPEPGVAGMERWQLYAVLHRNGLRHGPDHRGRFEVSMVVVNLTGRAGLDLLKMGVPGAQGIGSTVEVRIIAMAEKSAQETLAAVRAGTTAHCILPWVPLMQGADNPAIIEEWRALLASVLDARLRADYVVLATVFSELPGRARTWSAGLEGCDVEESTFVLEWTAKARAEGEAHGRAEGEARGRAEMLLRMGSLRLGEPSPAMQRRLDERLAAGELAELTERLLQVETWDELLG